MGMENNNLNDDEIAYILSFKEPIDEQIESLQESLNKMLEATQMQEPRLLKLHSDQAAYKTAELCMYHFTLGREFERQNATTH